MCLARHPLGRGAGAQLDNAGFRRIRDYRPRSAPPQGSSDSSYAASAGSTASDQEVLGDPRDQHAARRAAPGSGDEQPERHIVRRDGRRVRHSTGDGRRCGDPGRHHAVLTRGAGERQCHRIRHRAGVSLRSSREVHVHAGGRPACGRIDAGGGLQAVLTRVNTPGGDDVLRLGDGALLSRSRAVRRIDEGEGTRGAGLALLAGRAGRAVLAGLAPLAPRTLRTHRSLTARRELASHEVGGEKRAVPYLG